MIEVGDDGFYQHVLLRSNEIPVVVDFWAPWCGPCRQLAPVLESVAAEHAGQFVLAKVNIDESPAVASQYGVQSIPLVIGFRDGQPVDQFLGVQPESAVRAFVRGLAPSEADRLAREADELLSGGDAVTALGRFEAALEREPRHTRSLLGMARLLAARGEVQSALDALAKIVPDGSTDAQVDRLAAELRMQAVGGGKGDVARLRARAEADPDDLGARLELGRALAASGQHEPALAELLEIVKRDARFEDEAARKAMLDLFEVLGPHEPLTQSYRRALAKYLFR
jgi:putative thioredoxin